MQTSLTAQIAALRVMTVADLRLEWQRLYGEPTRSRNRDFLFRRLAWRLQELQHGGLSDGAKQRIEELAPESFIRARTPDVEQCDAPATAPEAQPRTRRDPRLPAPGTVITRQYRGRELRLLVLDDGFEMDGVRYGSLSEAARAATGSHWNGKLFWGVAQRKRRA